MDRYVAAPVYVAHDRSDFGGIYHDVRRVGTASEREYRWVFDQQQVITVAALQLLLQRVGLVVVDSAEPAHMKGLLPVRICHYWSSASQSLVSMIVRRRLRNAAA